MDYETRLKKLYNKFLSEMDQPLSSRYYEEDELLDIFDYASDIADDAVRMEVILLAQRLYPGSSDIAERKAMLYWGIGNDTAATKVMNTIHGKHFLARLTKLRIDKGKDGLSESDLSRLIKGVKAGSLPDEEIIQLIEAAEDSQQQKWLMDNYDRLKALAEYPETLMYDLVDPVIDWLGKDGSEFVGRLLDDLTMASPYDLGYWEFAAQTELERLDDPQRALGFVEYALAINPRSVKSLVMKSEALLNLKEPNVAEALKVAQAAYNLQPDSTNTCMAYAHALQLDNQPEKAVELIERYLHTPGRELEVVVTLASLSGESIDLYSILKSVVDNVDADSGEHQLDSVLTRFVECGSYEYAAQTMQLIEELGFQGNYKPEFLVELYFRTNRLEKALPYLNAAHPFDNRTWLLALLMSMPLPDKTAALDMIDERLKLIDASIKNGTLPEVLEASAVKAYAQMVRHCIETDGDFSIDQFSPFITAIPLKL